MMKNIDAAIIINRETDDSADPPRQYMGFKLEKYRGKPNDKNIYVFFHPFEVNNGILLTSDIGSKPLSRLRVEDFNPVGKTLMSSDGNINFDLLFKQDEHDKFIAGLKLNEDKEQPDAMHAITIENLDYVDQNNNNSESADPTTVVINMSDALNRAEKDLRERRKRESKDNVYKKNEDDMIIVSSSKEYREKKAKLDKRDGCFIIHSRKSKKKQDKEEEIITITNTAESKITYGYDEYLGLFRIKSSKKHKKDKIKKKDGYIVISKRNKNNMAHDSEINLPGIDMNTYMVA